MEDQKYTYLIRRKEDVQNLQVKLAQNNYNIAKMIGHKLKGHGTTFGFPKISELGIPLEEAAERKDMDSLKSITQELSAMIDQEIRELEKNNIN